jgi:hypothetical protein
MVKKTFVHFLFFSFRIPRQYVAARAKVKNGMAEGW